MKQPRNILLTDCSSYKAIIVANFIKRKYPHTVISGLDKSPLFRSIHSRYFAKVHIISGHTDKKTYSDTLEAIVSREGIDLIIPVKSNDLDNLLVDRNKFIRQMAYWGDYESYRMLSNKYNLSVLLKKLNILHPQTRNDIEALKPGTVLKLTDSSSAKGIYYIETEDDVAEYANIFKDRKDFVIQEYIKGEGVGYSVFAVDGNIIIGYGHRRLMEYPITGGSSVYRETYFHPNMAIIASQLLKETNWSGFAMFEFKLSRDNQLYLIEVNPRIWGSIHQGLVNGVDYFSWLLGDKTQKHELTAPQNKRTYLSPLIYKAMLGYILKGKGSKLIPFVKTMGNHKPDVSFFSDALGYISVILRKFV